MMVTESNYILCKSEHHRSLCSLKRSGSSGTPRGSASTRRKIYPSGWLLVRVRWIRQIVSANTKPVARFSVQHYASYAPVRLSEMKNDARNPHRKGKDLPDSGFQGYQVHVANDNRPRTLALKVMY